ncbi:MAG TPA: glycosyltransferase family 4 protein [Kouleothrix sp.]|uniref:glycosyltransferase family 4 protein n=1 Tax=Kouleothrix sp. TaxID=2779161 RepID=UPI002B9B3E68|nr:glycosyltransferase family 4 protein [Kouleothrix sp.]HRC75913.1 glycosyltransferase family 4 protein [Kouleothrix sp.]
MKIAFIDFIFDRNAPIGTTGLSEVVWCLAGPLAEMGNEVHVIAPYQRADYPAPNVHVHTFELPIINYRNIVGHILIVKRAIDVLRQFGPFDVVHAPEYLSTALLCRLYPDAPVVLTEPGNIFERIANGNPYDIVTTQVYKWAAATSGKRCARVIATSAEMADWWQRSGADEARIARIALGVDLDGFAPLPEARAQLRWEAGQQHILFVARLSVETGADYLLRALPAVAQAFPNVRLHVIGSGAAEPRLRQLAGDLQIAERVTWYGWVPLRDLARYYSAADVMAFPGTSGGTPRVMLQAMACGTPFVGSAIGGIVDHIQPNRTGWLVPPRDFHALARIIVEILTQTDCARQVAAQAQAYVHSLHWRTIAQHVYEDVYLKISP